MSYFFASAEGEASLSTQLDLRALTIIDIALTIDAIESFFSHEFVPHVPFAQETYSQGFENLKFGGSDTLQTQRAFDYIAGVSGQVRLPGIVAQSVTAAISGFPTLVEECTGEGVETGKAPVDSVQFCVPPLEALALDYELDPVSVPPTASALEAQTVSSAISNKFCHYVNGAGYRIFDEFSFRAGALVSEKFDHKWLYISEEMTGAAGKKMSYQAGVHKTREDLIRHSMHDQHLHVNIPLWFTYFYGNSLSVVRSQLAKYTYKAKAATIYQMIICSDSKAQPCLTTKSTGDNKDHYVTLAKTGNAEKAFSDRVAGAVLTKDEPLEIEIKQQVIYLEDSYRAEEMALAQEEETNVLMLFTESVSKTFKSLAKDQKVQIKFEGVNPLTCIYLVCQLQANVDCNDYYNFSRIGPHGEMKTRDGKNAANAGAGGHSSASYGAHPIQPTDTLRHPIKSLGLEFNGKTRLASAPAEHWLSYTAKLTHPNIPNKYANACIYTVPIALYGADASGGSGSANMARIKHASIPMVFDDDLCGADIALEVTAYVRQWGFWVTYNNTGGPRFASSLSLVA